MEDFTKIKTELSELSKFIERVRTSTLSKLDLQGFDIFIGKLERSYGDMDLSVHQKSLPFTSDGKIIEKTNTEEFNKFVSDDYESKLKHVRSKLKVMLNTCKRFIKEYRNEIELNASLFHPDIGILNELSEYLSSLIEWTTSELEPGKWSDDLDLSDLEDKHANLLGLFNKKQLESLREFKFRSEKEIDLFTDLGQKRLDILLNKTEKRAETLNDLSSKQETKLQELSDKVNGLELYFSEQIARTDSIYEEGLEDVTKKKSEIEGLLSDAGNRVMADDYDSSAMAEKKVANSLRGGSLTIMAVIVFIVCYSFYDSTHSGFDWESSIFRTVLVFILSIPAAYLSRESTKHREQQYNYHHTALDLKAITPYIASLPETDQNRIKISIAERIFASRQTNVAQQESFPLNTQELMMELIKKVDIKKEVKKDAAGVSEVKQ